MKTMPISIKSAVRVLPVPDTALKKIFPKAMAGSVATITINEEREAEIRLGSEVYTCNAALGKINKTSIKRSAKDKAPRTIFQISGITSCDLPAPMVLLTKVLVVVDRAKTGTANKM